MNGYRRSHLRCSVRKGVLRNFTKFTGKHLCQSLFFNKETLAQTFSCDFFEISKNTFFTEYLRATASLVKLLSYSRKKKITRNNDLLSFVVTRCHSLSLDVLLVCFFINSPERSWKLIKGTRYHCPWSNQILFFYRKLIKGTR